MDKLTNAFDLFQYQNAKLSPFYQKEEANQLATWYLLDFFGIKQSDIVIKRPIHLLRSQLDLLDGHLRRLQQNEPYQYICGIMDFLDIQFRVDRRALIPRPETEELVMSIVSERNPRHKRGLDIGTGTGCIAISLAKKLEMEFVGVDISNEALSLAAWNNHWVDTDVHFQNWDLFEPTPFTEKFDLIVANPPYVRESEKGQMAPNVLDYEPWQALFVRDEDPLLYYRRIFEVAENLLAAEGVIYLEINQYLSDRLKSLAANYGLSAIIRNDFRGQKRFARVTRGAV